MCGNVQNFLGTDTSDATWWPKLELMRVKIEEEEKGEKKSEKETLPEAQRTQGIESMT